MEQLVIRYEDSRHCLGCDGPCLYDRASRTWVCTRCGDIWSDQIAGYEPPEPREEGTP